MTHKLKFLVASLAIVMGGAHAAGQVFVHPFGQQTSQVNGGATCNVSFDGMTANNNCGAIYSGTTPSSFVIGTLPGQYAMPNGDTTPYLSVGPASGATSLTISLDSPRNYFGFLTGSLDAYNTVEFYLGSSLVDSFTGTYINTIAFGGQANGDQSKSVYVDYFVSDFNQQQAFYDRVVYSSTSNAFETDNHAFVVASLPPVPVPEPESLALMGIAGLALVAARRRKRR